MTAFWPQALAAARPCPTSRASLSSSSPKAQAAPDDPRRAAEVYGERYRANPKDADAALRYGQALRATGQRAQAAAVLEQATIANPGNKALLAAYGRALADNGNSQAAFDVLSRAHSPANPDWRILSVQGTTLDQIGRHEEARRYYASALKIVPEEPSVLSNLGLSYMLTRESAAGRGNAAARLCQSAAPTAGCGRTWRWWSACRAASRKPRPSPRPICRRRGRRQRGLSAGDAEPQGQGQFASARQQAAVPVAALNRPD